MNPKLLLIAISTCFAINTLSQDSISPFDRVTGFPAKFPEKVNQKTASLDERLTRQTEKYLQRLLKSEARLKKKLLKSDSNAATTLFSYNPADRYNALLNKMKSATAGNATAPVGEYMPYIDSLKGSLAFFNANPQLLESSKIIPGDIQKSLEQLQQLQAKMQGAEQVKQYIQQRREQIKRYLSQYTHLPKGISAIYKEYSKQAYYYSQQLKEYRAILNDPDKMMTTALRLLNKVPAFTRFMQKNSMLAGLFNMPGGAGNTGSAQSVTGLQTRNQVMTLLQNQLGGGPNASAVVGQSLQSAQQQVDDLRSRLSLKGISGGELDMPDFKPNPQKTKTFWQRLEYGTNLQTVQGSSFFPATTDIGLSVGYKLNDKSIIGIGASYKMGWGKDIRHIDITSEGAGVRSFIDVNLKKSFFISGGFEYNYQQPFNSLIPPTGVNVTNWQQSGLIGVSKIVSVKSKVLKKTKLQFLWDFLSYSQVPQTTPLKFRVGYSF